MHRSLIVARIAPGAEDDVARIFAESDRTELPAVAGIRHRSLYTLGDCYIHLIESDDPGREAVERARQHPEFGRVSAALDPYITPYLSTWRGPQDAAARRFYTYEASDASSEAVVRR